MNSTKLMRQVGNLQVAVVIDLLSSYHVCTSSMYVSKAENILGNNFIRRILISYISSYPSTDK